MKGSPDQQWLCWNQIANSLEQIIGDNVDFYPETAFANSDILDCKPANVDSEKAQLYAAVVCTEQLLRSYEEVNNLAPRNNGIVCISIFFQGTQKKREIVCSLLFRYIPS